MYRDQKGPGCVRGRLRGMGGGTPNTSEAKKLGFFMEVLWGQGRV